MEADDIGTIFGNLQRGQQLLALRRFTEAEEYFRQALAQDPNNAMILHMLAMCLLQEGGRLPEALEFINRAIAAQPENAELFAIKAIVLAEMRKGSEALSAAEEAVRLDPANEQAYAAKAQAYLSLEKWSDAEAAAREALAIDPNAALPANQLAAALRLQNRTTENAEQIAGMLARDPEDADNHTSAGWNYLQQGNRAKAEEHFAEALRREPGKEFARQGMIEAFRSRSPLYRGYLKWCFFLTSLSPSMRWGLIIGLVIFVNVANRIFSGPYAGIGFTIVVLYMLMVLWVHIARGVGNFMLLFDRFARHALLPAEKIEAWAVGGAILSGSIVLITALATWLSPLFGLAFLLLGSAFPLSYIFTNESAKGRAVFGSLAALCLIAAGAMILSFFVTSPGFISLAEGLSYFGLIAAAATTWLAGVPALRR